MSMYLNFEPHSWYKHFAIEKKTLEQDVVKETPINYYLWHAYADDGNTYNIVTLFAPTLAELKKKITDYRDKK